MDWEESFITSHSTQKNKASLKIVHVPYFLGYKTDFFSFQNNPKDLDPSYKTDLDHWDCFGIIKLVL